jgi:NAD/NADP transhydrogenase alpha subunit
MDEVALLKEGSTLFSFLYPAQNKGLVDKLAEKKMTAFAMDCVPRISRAQVSILGDTHVEELSCIS